MVAEKWCYSFFKNFFKTSTLKVSRLPKINRHHSTLSPKTKINANDVSLGISIALFISNLFRNVLVLHLNFKLILSLLYICN